MNSKKAQSLANFLLVFLTLAIVATSLSYVSIKENSHSKDFNSPYILDSVYSREEVINFYLQDIINHASIDVKSKQELIENIKLIALKYEENNEDILVVLKSIGNLNGDDIKFIENKGKIESVDVNFNIEIYYSDDSLNSVKYIYSKNFVASTIKTNVLEA